MYKIKYTKDALDDLDIIFDYISDNNRIDAISTLSKIENTILLLKDNPRIGTILSTNELSIVKSGYRKIIINPYIIFYRIGDDEVYISRVLHSKQDWLHLLFE